MGNETLYVVLPCYNEEANIESVVRDWSRALEGKNDGSRIVVADSGSTDRTHEILLNLQKEFPPLEILHDTGRYHGEKVIALYDYAITRGADWIFQTDSDGQTNPDEFDSFWRMRGEFDGIFGNRTARGDGKSRAFVEKVVCLLLRLYFGVKIPDANAPFRLMRAKIVQKYLGRMSADYNLPNIMLTTFFSRYGERIAFKEITFRPRQGGVNSINIPRIVKIGFKALRDFAEFRREMEHES